MMLFHHRHRAPSSSQNVVEPSSTTTQPAPKPSPPPRTVPVGRSRTQEDVYCLNFLPTLSFEPLPPTFKPPHGHHAAHQLLCKLSRPHTSVLGCTQSNTDCEIIRSLLWTQVQRPRCARRCGQVHRIVQTARQHVGRPRHRGIRS